MLRKGRNIKGAFIVAVLASVMLMCASSADAALQTSSTYREIYTTPAEFKDEDNPLGKVGNIVFSDSDLPPGDESGYSIQDTFTQGEQNKIQGRAYYPDTALDIVRAIGPDSGFSKFQFEMDMFDSSGKSVSDPMSFIEQYKPPEGWEEWEQFRIHVFPNEYLERGYDIDPFLDFVDTLAAGTYEARCSVWLIASPGKFSKMELEGGVWVENWYWEDDQWYVVSVGSFNYVVTGGSAAVPSEIEAEKVKEEEVKEEEEEEKAEKVIDEIKGFFD